MTTPLSHLLLAGASLAADSAHSAEDIRRARASGAAAGRSRLCRFGQNHTCGQPAQRQPFDHRHRDGPRGGRARRGSAAWLTWRCSRETGVCWSSMKRHVSSCSWNITIVLSGCSTG